MLREFDLLRVRPDWPELFHAVVWAAIALVAAAVVHRVVFALLTRLAKRTPTPRSMA